MESANPRLFFQLLAPCDMPWTRYYSRTTTKIREAAYAACRESRNLLVDRRSIALRLVLTAAGKLRHINGCLVSGHSLTNFFWTSQHITRE